MKKPQESFGSYLVEMCFVFFNYRKKRETKSNLFGERKNKKKEKKLVAVCFKGNKLD